MALTPWGITCLAPPPFPRDIYNWLRENPQALLIAGTIPQKIPQKNNINAVAELCFFL